MPQADKYRLAQRHAAISDRFDGEALCREQRRSLSLLPQQMLELGRS